MMAFFAMRRSDEIFVNKGHSHGLLQQHVQLHCPSHVSIFVQGQKTDSYHKGHYVVLAWISGSGVPIGGWIQRLFLRLEECGRCVPASPLFLPTMGNHGFKCVTQGQPVSKPDTFKRLLPRVFPMFQSHPHFLVLFNWHSCRRWRYPWVLARRVFVPPGPSRGLEHGGGPQGICCRLFLAAIVSDTAHVTCLVGPQAHGVLR